MKKKNIRKNSNYNKLNKLTLSQNLTTQIWTNITNKNCDEKWSQNSATQILTNLININCDENKTLKL